VLPDRCARNDLPLHHYRNPKIRRIANPDAEEIGRRYADDRKRMAIHRDALTNNGRIARKTPLPVVVTDDDDRTGAGDIVVLLGDVAAEQRVNAEDRKKAAGNLLRIGDFSLPVDCDIDSIAAQKSADTG